MLCCITVSISISLLINLFGGYIFCSNLNFSRIELIGFIMDLTNFSTKRKLKVYSLSPYILLYIFDPIC